MKTKLSQEYYPKREAIREKYKEKARKIFKKYLIGFTAVSILTFSSYIGENIKSKNLKENYPIHQEYIDNQNSLRYLRNELNQYKPERFPEFLSKDIKNELENISVQEDLAKVSSLEKVVKIAEQDSARIVNTPRFKEYSEKRERIKNVRSFYWLGTGFLFIAIPGLGFLAEFYRRRKNKELTALDKKFGVVPEES